MLSQSPTRILLNGSLAKLKPSGCLDELKKAAQAYVTVKSHLKSQISAALQSQEAGSKVRSSAGKSTTFLEAVISDEGRKSGSLGHESGLKKLVSELTMLTIAGTVTTSNMLANIFAFNASMSDHFNEEAHFRSRYLDDQLCVSCDIYRSVLVNPSVVAIPRRVETETTIRYKDSLRKDRQISVTFPKGSLVYIDNLARGVELSKAEWENQTNQDSKKSSLEVFHTQFETRCPGRFILMIRWICRL